MDIHTTLDFLLVSIFRRQIPIKVGEDEEFGVPERWLKWNGTIIFEGSSVISCMNFLLSMGCDGSQLSNKENLQKLNHASSIKKTVKLDKVVRKKWNLLQPQTTKNTNMNFVDYSLMQLTELGTTN